MQRLARLLGAHGCENAMSAIISFSLLLSHFFSLVSVTPAVGGCLGNICLLALFHPFSFVIYKFFHLHFFFFFF